MVFRHGLFGVMDESAQNKCPTGLQFYAPHNGWGSITTGTSSSFPFSQQQVIYPKQPAVDIKEDDDQVIVTIDVPGIKKDNIKLRLVNTKTLEFMCEHENATEDKKENYFIRERFYGCVKRTISLPKDVTELDAKTKFEDGILTVFLNKIRSERQGYIQIK